MHIYVRTSRARYVCYEVYFGQSNRLHYIPCEVRNLSLKVEQAEFRLKKNILLS
jgi:hypothetical protein